MTNQRDDEDKTLGTLGAYSIGGPALAGAYVLGGILREEPRDRDLGPAPIGSDPWLLREIKAAIHRDNPEHEKFVEVTVLEAVVTLHSKAAPEQTANIERAARTVEGIKQLIVTK